MQLAKQNVLIIGGSRGLGLGLARVLTAQQANVTIVARGEADLAAAQNALGVNTIRGDAVDAALALETLQTLQPNLLILNVGAPPPMASLHAIKWEDFSTNWMVDVRANLTWIQAALTTPLPLNTRVLLISSGAAVGGSPLSGGYAGAKRMQWFLAKYATSFAKERNLSLQFQTIVPTQMAPDTGVGMAGATAYAAKDGITVEQVFARFGAPLTPQFFGEKVAAILTQPEWTNVPVLGIGTANGISVLEAAAAAA